jgi:murein DD-endopeptidase MepM/ murein hydrolase activator NlpD
MDLSRIPEDVRQAGIGGAPMEVDFNTSLDVNAELNSLRTSMTMAEKELQLQFASYREIAEKYTDNKTRFSSLPAIRPMNGYYSRQGPRVRLHPILNIYRRHEGIDIAADPGTPIYAPADGVVEYTGRSGGFGIAIELNHGFAYRTLFGHLSKALVREGQRVKRGTLIARSGNTGLSSGPHLHYEVRKNGVPQNPLEYFFDDVDYIAEAGAPLPDEAMERLYIED